MARFPYLIPPTYLPLTTSIEAYRSRCRPGRRSAARTTRLLFGLVAAVWLLLSVLGMLSAWSWTHRFAYAVVLACLAGTLEVYLGKRMAELLVD